MKPWNHCSASQFKTFSLCERKWWFEKRSGLPQPPPSTAMLLGTEVHALLETYLLTGEEPTQMDRASKIVRGGIESGLVPTPQSVTVEGRIQLDDCDPPLVGFIDVLDITGGSPGGPKQKRA
jgi:CRISPR/Cas system-associated exonuclease Cas4 (RecB family)